ncbi:SH3 domain-containing protein [Dankookia sp. GCM10030260]|uniref:SH3 domain-containing protein n=1 Tax=Dankookia sp. GCM10030260 TaxID=3273390 RepID=UPI00361D3DBA
MMQQRERLYQLEKPILSRDAAAMAAPNGPVIPPGWIGLEQCNLSSVQGQVLRVPHVLLHPEIGVALIDIAPGESVGAEPAFRTRLEAARFAAIFPGQLPVVHLQLQPEELDRLDTLLPQSFATLPVLNLPGGDGWVSVVRRALASRGPLRDGLAAPAQDRAVTPPMLSREVAAQRAGLTPADPAAMIEPPRTGWPVLPVALGLAGLCGVVVAAVVFSTAPERTAAPAAVVADRSGAPAAAPMPTGGGVAAPAKVVPPPAPAVPSAPARVAANAPRPPEPVAAPTVVPPLRDRVPAAVPPPPAAVAPERTPRLTVRAAANIRSSPNNKAPILRTAPQGEVLREFSRSFDDWVEVGDKEPQGWMFGKFLVPVKP